MTYIVEVSKGKKLANVGGKAAQYGFLLDQAVLVPKTFVIQWDAFVTAEKNETAVLQTLRLEIETLLNDKRPYAVRSSANVEDGGQYSFAGQFESVLDVRGVDAILEAVQTVWQSARRESLRPYLEQAGLTASDVKMAVILQEMVDSKVSGVAFSKNPMTGMDETIVEAVPGSGEALVQEGVTPNRWVHKWGDWMIQTNPDKLPLSLIETIVSETKRMAKAYGAPIDLEWVWDGTAVNWVQIREITTLKDISVYSNRISREVMPGIIKPLIWSVNVPVVNSAWVDLIEELIGPHDIQAEDLAKSFHYRSYFNMSTLGRVFTTLGMPTETLELMMGLEGGDEKPRYKPSNQTYRYLPRMLRFGLDKLRFSRKIDAFLPMAEARYKKFANQDLSQLDEKTLLSEIEQLFEFTKRMAYVNVVGPLLMLAHNGRFQRQIEALDIDYVNFDLMNNAPDLEKYDPSNHLDRLADLYKSLDKSVQEKLAVGPVFELIKTGVAKEFTDPFFKFVKQFGHFSDSGNDFSAKPWRENFDFVLQMVINHERLGSDNQKVNWEALPLSGLKRWRLKSSYERARKFRFYRERISYDYTFGYGLFRNYFFALAGRLVDRNVLTEKEDIFYLYLNEVQQIVGQTRLDFEPMTLVNTRRAEIESVKDYILPDIVYGDDPPPPETAVADQDLLNGIPTSRGYYQGPVRVINSIQEFDKMVPGAVIVIPYSDVSWTPLFTKAGAVIAESGGMLSHSSIVAREYNLPAVVSVTNACRILQDDTIVSVDGFKGQVSVV
ncbi:MAG: PEP/pyruvate-binding domain-containing protein [Chloroflexota bacterium]